MLMGFSHFTKFTVGDGLKILFWYDVWCANQYSKAAFLELFSIELKDAYATDHCV